MTTQAQVTERYNSVISSFKSGLVKNPKLTLKDQVKKSHIEPNSSNGSKKRVLMHEESKPMY